MEVTAINSEHIYKHHNHNILHEARSSSAYGRFDRKYLHITCGTVLVNRCDIHEIVVCKQVYDDILTVWQK